MSNEQQGAFGESLFEVAITRGYLFRPQHLGGNWPTSDFYVELNGLNEKLFFIVQVKSSIRGYDKNGNLRIQVPKSKLNQLRNYFAPTYLAGVDIPGEKVYLTAINFVATKDVNKISTTFEVNEQTLKTLYQEVQHFWLHSGLKTYKEQYKHAMV
jgi:hypothetical protein